MDEEFISAALFLLKGFVIELIQFLSDRLIQFGQRKELFITKRGNDPGGYMSNGAFGIWFILGCSNSGRNDGCAIMLRQRAINLIDSRIVIAVALAYDRCFAVIRNKEPGDCTKVFIHMDVGCDPRGLFLIDAGFCIYILAVTHYANEYGNLRGFSGVGIDQIGGITCPVHLDLFSGFAIDVHRCTAFLFILWDVVTET